MAFCRVLDCFTLDAVETVYYPHFLCGIIFCGSAEKRDFETSFRLKKKNLRMLTRSSRYAITDFVFAIIDILKLSNILKFEICKFGYRDFYINKIFILLP